MSSWLEGISKKERAHELANRLADACCDDATLEERASETLPHLRSLNREEPDVVSECASCLRSDGRFDLLPTSFQQTLWVDPFFQTEDLEGGISTLTSVRMEGYDPERVLEAMVDMPWSRWWSYGRVVKWRRTTEGADFFLWPVWLKVPIRVRITIDGIFEESEQSGDLRRRKIVMPASFRGCFEGPARFEILTLPDGCVLRAAWEGIRPRGWVRLLSYQRMARNHLDVERGVMAGAPGTGYLGMRHYLASATS